MILQRYTFGSKSQPQGQRSTIYLVAYDIAKIYIWKQITTDFIFFSDKPSLLMILQR